MIAKKFNTSASAIKYDRKISHRSKFLFGDWWKIDEKFDFVKVVPQTHTIKTESDFYLRAETGFGRKKSGISVCQLWRSKTRYFQTKRRVKALWRLRQGECVESARMLNTGQALGVIQRPGRKPVFFSRAATLVASFIIQPIAERLATVAQFLFWFLFFPVAISANRLSSIDLSRSQTANANFHAFRPSFWNFLKFWFHLPRRWSIFKIRAMLNRHYYRSLPTVAVRESRESISQFARVCNIHIAGETRIDRNYPRISLMKLQIRQLLPRRDKNILQCNTVIVRKSILARNQSGDIPCEIASFTGIVSRVITGQEFTRVYTCVHSAPLLYIITADLVLIIKMNARRCDSPACFALREK